MIMLSFDLGVIGGLITSVCSCIVSEGILCHSTVVCRVVLGIVVLGIVDLFVVPLPFYLVINPRCEGEGHERDIEEGLNSKVKLLLYKTFNKVIMGKVMLGLD